MNSKCLKKYLQSFYLQSIYWYVDWWIKLDIFMCHAWNTILDINFVKLCFLHNIFIGCISWQKCCNFNYLFPCILWDLIVMGLVLSWWKLLKTIEFMTSSPLAWDCRTREKLCEEHMRKLNSQDVSRVTRALANLWVTKETLWMLGF